ncbi:MAG TPA: PAS domain-containing protein [Vicinamibacterales bacterium]|nr:PAS domain-containing protein [Vicinamibacterales bacterium]
MPTDDLYRRAAVAGGVGVWHWNLETGEIHVDPFIKEILGFADHEIRDHVDEWAKLVHPDDAASALERVEAHLNGATSSYDREYRMRHRDGSYRWFHSRGSVSRNEQGAIVRFAGTVTDVTERKRAEEALRRAQELNRRIVDSTGDCVKILDLEGRLLYINPVGLRLMGIPDGDELLNRLLVEFFHGEMRQAADRAIASARRGGAGRFHYSMRMASGVTKWFDAVVTPITDANGAVVQLLVISRDITERRREDAFRAAQHQVLEMIATGTALAAVLDSLARLVEGQADGMFCTVLLLDEDGITVRHGAAPSLPPGYVQAINGLMVGPNAGSCGTAMYLGERVIVTDILTDPLWEGHRDVAQKFGLRACWSMPIFSPRRKVLGSFAMYYTEPREPSDRELRLIETAADIARIAIEQQRSYQEADAQRRQLAHLNRVATLGELSGALAHELSQPLTAVLTNAQAARHFLNRQPLDVEQLRDAVEDIIKNDKRAGAVIDRLRALLRKEEIARQPVDLSDVVREVIDLAVGELTSRRINVKSALAPAVPSVLGDRIQLQQVVLNLVLNACDAMNTTDTGDRLLMLSTRADDGFVELAVSDRGPGIPDGQLERVFEPFVTFREQGLGLGLAISRSIVAAHGGSIHAENNADGGATFRCFLPTATPNPSSRPSKIKSQSLGFQPSR